MNNCFNYNERNYMCTVCKPPYGEINGSSTFACYEPKAIVTVGDKIRESNDSLAKRVYRLGVGCDWCVNGKNKGLCKDKFCHEGILEFLNQPFIE